MCHVTHNEHKKPCKHTHMQARTQRKADRNGGTCYVPFFLPFFIFMWRELAVRATVCVCVIVCVWLCVCVTVCVWVWLCLLTSLTNCQITRNSIKNLNSVRASSKAPKSRQPKYAQMPNKTGCCCFFVVVASQQINHFANGTTKVLVNKARNEPIMYKA